MCRMSPAWCTDRRAPWARYIYRSFLTSIGEKHWVRVFFLLYWKNNGSCFFSVVNPSTELKLCEKDLGEEEEEEESGPNHY